MNKRALYTLTVILIILAAVAFLPASDKEKQPAETPVLETRLTGKDGFSGIASVRILSPADSEIHIYRQNDEFFVEYDTAISPADTEKIGHWYDELSNINFDEIISRSADKFALFEVDEGSALKIIVEDSAGDTAALWLGKSAPGGYVYVRTSNADLVYLAKNINRYSIERSADYFRK